MNKDCQYEFLGFNPDERIRNFVSVIADNIYNMAPSDSGLQLVFQKSKDAVIASCRIISAAGPFVAEVVCDSPMQAARQIDKKIRDQIEIWRSRRFEKK